MRETFDDFTLWLEDAGRSTSTIVAYTGRLRACANNVRQWPPSTLQVAAWSQALGMSTRVQFEAAWRSYTVFCAETQKYPGLVQPSRKSVQAKEHAAVLAPVESAVEFLLRVLRGSKVNASGISKITWSCFRAGDNRAGDNRAGDNRGGGGAILHYANMDFTPGLEELAGETPAQGIVAWQTHLEALYTYAQGHGPRDTLTPERWQHEAAARGLEPDLAKYEFSAQAPQRMPTMVARTPQGPLGGLLFPTDLETVRFDPWIPLVPVSPRARQSMTAQRISRMASRAQARRLQIAPPALGLLRAGSTEPPKPTTLQPPPLPLSFQVPPLPGALGPPAILSALGPTASTGPAEEH